MYLIVYIFAGIGSLFTAPMVNTAWYNSIKSNLTPPNWVFPVVWNILFLLIGVSLFYAFTSSKNKKQKNNIVKIYTINLILNALWGVLFFGFGNPLAALFDLIAIWLSIVLTMIVVWKIDRKSVYLLIPYLLWVSFAGILNYSTI